MCKIKLCGLKTEADVAAAAALSIDAVGFVLSESPRKVTPDLCLTLRDALPPAIRAHGVFAAESPAFIRDCLERCRLDVAQIHDPEDDPAYWSRLGGIPIVRAFRVRDAGVLDRLEAVRGEVFLLDAYVENKPGGTGETFDWTVARKAAAYGDVILAGGLSPENVGEAIRRARPYMVDVSGGIEREKGIKDPARMRAFVEAVRKAE